MNTAQWIRLGVELVIDLVRGKLETPKAEPARGLPYRDVERQLKAAREAGPASRYETRGRPR